MPCVLILTKKTGQSKLFRAPPPQWGIGSRQQKQRLRAPKNFFGVFLSGFLSSDLAELLVAGSSARSELKNRKGTPRTRNGHLAGFGVWLRG